MNRFEVQKLKKLIRQKDIGVSFCDIFGRRVDCIIKKGTRYKKIGFDSYKFPVKLTNSHICDICDSLSFLKIHEGRFDVFIIKFRIRAILFHRWMFKKSVSNIHLITIVIFYISSFLFLFLRLKGIL